MLNVSVLSGASYTPKLCLHDVMEDVEDMESVAVVAHYKDGSTQTFLSHMVVSRLCLFAKALDRKVYNAMEEAASVR